MANIEGPQAPESPPASLSFAGQRQKVPCTLKDYIPHSLVGLPSHLRPAPQRHSTAPAELDVLSLSSPPTPESEPAADTGFTTEPNGFGLYHKYNRKPLTDPEEALTLTDLVYEDALQEQQQSEARATEA